MDEINGLDLCSQIRSLPYYSQTPIVFLTGMKTLDMRAQSSLVGGNDFITKPFHASEIKLKAIFWALKDQIGSC
jgi:DNA-binding response OmpR family regulator